MTLLRQWGLAFLVVAVVPGAQAQTKRPLTQADWDLWRSISGATLSRDGRWVGYTLVPQVGDGELVLRATTGTTEYRVPRGYVGRPNNVPGGLRGPAGGTGEGDPTGPNVSPAQFTSDGRFALVLTQPGRAEVERAGNGRRGGARGNAATRTSLAIVDLADGRVTTIANVRSFRLPRETAGWVAYVPIDTAASDSGRAGGPAGARGPGAAPAARDRRTYGNPLVLRNLATGAEERLTDVLGFAFDDSAKVLGYTVVSRDSTRDGAYLRTMATGATRTLLAGRGNYKGLVIDSLATQVAFYSDREEFGAARPRYGLYHARIGGRADGRAGGRTSRGAAADSVARVAVAPAMLPEGWRIADHAAIGFAGRGTGVLFGIAPPVPDSLPADSLADKAVFDLWHWRDPALQPTQRLNATRDRNRSFQSIWTPATGKWVQLASDSLPTVDLSDDGRLALAASRERYRISSMWGDTGTDLYLIDVATGAPRLVKEKITGQGRLSPDGKYLIWFDRDRWYSHVTATGKTVDLTGGIQGVSFAQETWDTPSPPAPWGLAGWTTGDRSALLYDRWDVWEVDPTGAKPPVMVTDSLGRKERMALRVVDVRRRAGGGGFGGGGGPFGGGGAGADQPIDPNEPLWLRAFDDDTKASGFFRDRLGRVTLPERIALEDVAYGVPSKAEDADVWMVTKGTFTQFPDLWVGPSLTQLSRISDANPQQKDYNWGTVELVEWTSADGVPLQGLLYKPEDFDPSKKYPLIAYFYEQLSQNRHAYVPPNGRNVINPTHYASNGYLIFEPDIHYEPGYPGPSALKSIVPGVQMLLARGYVDPKRLGLQGQSWGGYQTTYLITQTQMFAAAMAGAPVANMTSAYGGIRWGSGLARAFQYETGQSRIGESIWEAPLRYLENSPLFWLDKVTTPLLMMHNDMDDAVPWYQGIEMFVGLRRLQKEVYLLNYNNDVHNPASRANQKDVAMRMEQFFDAKLKGKPAPEWMTKGIPYLAKGRDQVPVPAALTP